MLIVLNVLKIIKSYVYLIVSEVQIKHLSHYVNPRNVHIITNLLQVELIRQRMYRKK
jgi:hypothetical protein